MVGRTEPGRSPVAWPQGRDLSQRDTLLDSIKVLALWRVVVWHALAWPWLSWFAAMPAMFYVAGLLLVQSLDRHGYRATLVSRLRRLLLPMWGFAAVAVAVMASSGWRPDAADLLWWIVPLADPQGLDTTPGLWVPLWYLRAYLWVVIAGPGLAAMARRWGRIALLVPTGATLLVWWWQQQVGDVPLAVADVALFPFFVLAGMLTATGQIGRDRGAAMIVAIGAGATAVLWASAAGVPSGTVNSSLPLHLLMGVATIGLLVAVGPLLAHPRGATAALVQWSSRRSLTIYLWHGLALVVADRTVHNAGWAPAVATVAGLVVVLLVTVAAALTVGGLEDRAARRPRAPVTRPVLVAALPGLMLVGAGLFVADLGDRDARTVPSGEVVLARGATAEIVVDPNERPTVRVTPVSEASLDREALQEAFERWLAGHDGLLDELDTQLIEVALVDANDDPVVLQWTRDGSPIDVEPFPWWSMSKTTTAAWMMQLSDQGLIDVERPLGEHLDAVPYGDQFTFEQLAGHRSGVPSVFDHNILSASPIDEVGAWFEEPELGFEPGEGFDYSRVGYHILTWGLEEASGSSWRSAMESMAEAAGAAVSVDEDYILAGRNTHPGGGEYRGALWGAGGLHGTTIDGARLMRWILVEALDPRSVERMTTSPATSPAAPSSVTGSTWSSMTSEQQAYYGLGIMPFCPCRSDGEVLWSNRVGLSTITGSYVVDLDRGVGAMMRTDSWWHTDDRGPALEFDDLLRALLDTVSTP